jgi:hypothetical protein
MLEAAGSALSRRRTAAATEELHNRSALFARRGITGPQMEPLEPGTFPLSHLLLTVINLNWKIE